MKKNIFIFLFIFCKFLIGDNFSVSPIIFSPYESPGKKDTTTIGGTMEQTRPVNVNIYLQGSNNLFRTIPYSEFNYNYDTISNRGVWDGKDNFNNFLPDGVYELKFKTFIEKIWSKGNENLDNRGMFKSPYDVAIGSDGKIYILDIDRIQIFDSNRNYISSIWNPKYSQPGHWSWVTSIAIYGNRIYLMDCGYGEQNIKIFDKNGTFIKSFGKGGSKDGEFDLDWLNNIAVDNNGRIWVVDSGNSRIQVFDSEGNFLFKFGSNGTGDGQFKFEAVNGNIAIDSNGNAYITDDGNMFGRIQIFNSNGVYQRTIRNAYEGGPIQLIGINGPIAIMGSTNKICVSSYNRWKIIILNNDGTYYAQIGGSGPSRGQGEFDFFLSNIRGTNNNLYTVENWDNKRVQIFNTSGSFVAQIGMTQGDFLVPRGITIGPNGNIYVCDYENIRIQIFNPEGTFQSQILIPYSSNYTILKPSCIVVDTDGKLYVTSSGSDTNGRLQVLNSSGSIIYDVLLKDNQDNYIFVTGITIIGNYLYISGGYLNNPTEGKIFVFDKKGVFQNSFGSLEYNNYLSYLNTENHISSHSGKIYTFDNTGIKIYQIDGTLFSSFPLEDPPTSINVDNTGKIYLSDWYVVEVFDSNGNFLYRFGRADYGTELYMESRGIIVDNSLNIYFTDSENHQLHKFSTNADILLGTTTCEIDNTKPTSTITYPPHTPINILTNFQITGSATDKNFEKYEVYRDSYLINSGTSPVSNNVLANIDISGLSSGSHKISLIVYDLAGNTNTDSVIFYIDNTPPFSYINGLNTYTNSLSFEVSWAGNDFDSGIACYDIQYKDGEEGQWTDWLVSTTQTSAIFTGEDGHTYYFRSRARDNAGNWEDYPEMYDTYTKIDITKPIVVKVKPSNNSFVGSNPTITIEITDPNNGSGIKSSSISVKIDGNNQPFNFSNDVITIKPTFTKGIHTIEVKFSDNAGNWADTLNLSYDALNFQGSVTTLSPDINPNISEVMIGGKVVRYYKVLDKNNNPAEGVSLLIQWADGTKSLTTDSSDENGIVKCIIQSNELGSLNQTITCSIVEAGGYAINPPITFNVKILPRESESEFKFGSGINLEAAVGVGGKVGQKKGMSYKIINTNLQSQSDDKIEVEREFEIEAGVVAKAAVGGGVKNSCYASAEAGVYASLVLMNTNTYLFDNPYNSDEQQILRSGLVIASLLESTNLPIISDMLNFIISGFNAFYPKYQDKQELSIGIRAGGEASAGAGLGIGDKDNVFLGLGIGAGIEGEIEVLGKLLFDYIYENNDLKLEEFGAGFSVSGELDLFGGVQGNVINDEIKGGIGGELSGKISITLYADNNGNITKGEVEIESKSEWGIKYPGKEGTTKKFIITLTREQIEGVINYLVDFLSLEEYLNGQTPSNSIILGPTELADRFVIFCQELSDYLIESGIPLTYKIEEEIDSSFTFEPSIQVALGAEVEVGISIEFEKAVSYTKEEGIFGKGGLILKKYPLYLYEKDDYIPSCSDLSFETIFNDCVDGIITAMTDLEELVIEVVEEIGDAVVSGIHWISSTVNEYIPFLNRNLKQTGTGIDEIFSFLPEGFLISDLSSQINSTKIITNGNSSLKINPGENKGILTINYDDAGIPVQIEGKLIIYQWDNINRRWIGLESEVDTNTNSITAEIQKLGTFRIGLPVPYGEIILKVEPKDVDINNITSINVTSEPIFLVTGDIVPDGTLITISSLNKNTSEIENYGTIVDTDEDPNTEGIQISTINGIISFSITPPNKEGSGLIITKSVKGNAEGKAYFNVVRNLDTDDNGLPDYWEIEYFGTKGQNANEDPDGDGLKNIDEYKNRTNPKKKDTDNDGMDDKWEIDNKLNPLLDDSNFDPDLDGYTNIVEFQYNTDPQDKNSNPGTLTKGDINKDKQIDISDVILCLRMAIGLNEPDLNSADMDENGEIDITDVIKVLRKAIGLD